MALTDDLSVIADAYVQKLKDNAQDLGLEDVFYGDQALIPTTPVACVETDSEEDTLKGATRITNITFTLHVLLYHSKVGSPQENRRESDQMATRVKRLINADRELRNGSDEPLVIHCYVTGISAGYSEKGNSVLRSSRVTIQATSQAQLPS